MYRVWLEDARVPRAASNAVDWEKTIAAVETWTAVRSEKLADNRRRVDDFCALYFIGEVQRPMAS